MASSCFHIGGPIVSAGPKQITWECSHCGARKRWLRSTFAVLVLDAGPGEET